MDLLASFQYGSSDTEGSQPSVAETGYGGNDNSTVEIDLSSEDVFSKRTTGDECLPLKSVPIATESLDDSATPNRRIFECVTPLARNAVTPQGCPGPSLTQLSFEIQMTTAMFATTVEGNATDASTPLRPVALLANFDERITPERPLKPVAKADYHKKKKPRRPLASILISFRKHVRRISVAM